MVLYSNARFSTDQAVVLSVTEAIGFALLDTLWSRADWDGRISNGEASAEGGTGEDEPRLLSSQAWESLTVALERDSELRLLVVVLRVRGKLGRCRLE